MAFIPKFFLFATSSTIFAFGWYIQKLVKGAKDVNQVLNGELKKWAIWGVVATVIFLALFLVLMFILVRTRKIATLNQDMKVLLAGLFFTAVIYLIVFSILVNIRNSDQSLPLKTERLLSLTNYLLGIGGFASGFCLGYFTSSIFGCGINNNNSTGGLFSGLGNSTTTTSSSNDKDSIFTSFGETEKTKTSSKSGGFFSGFGKSKSSSPKGKK